MGVLASGLFKFKLLLKTKVFLDSDVLGPVHVFAQHKINAAA